MTGVTARKDIIWHVVGRCYAGDGKLLGLVHYMQRNDRALLRNARLSMSRRCDLRTRIIEVDSTFPGYLPEFFS